MTDGNKPLFVREKKWEERKKWREDKKMRCLVEEKIGKERKEKGREKKWWGPH